MTMRFSRRHFTALGLAMLATPLAATPGFDAWLSGFRKRATAAGISRKVLDAALKGATHLPKVIESDKKQVEVTRTLEDYVGTAASPARIKGGTAALKRHKSLLGKIERKYGVEKEVIVAIWGMESSFGGFRGKTPVISTLATLAYEGRRADLFEQELLAALKILQASDTNPANMVGSYAGAMGHTQFMPSTFLAHAVDFDGNGRRDIWSDDPTDALASTAAYLRASGWKKGKPWAIEVRLPAAFDLALTGRVHIRSHAEWSKLGVRSSTGKRLPDHGPGGIILPAGPEGPVFMIYDNFHVLKTYNYADSYVIGTGHLSDRLAGGGSIRASYPKNPWGMTDDQRKLLQKRLNARGYDAGNPDGIIGEKGRAAIRAYEAATGQRETGVPSKALLKRLN